MRKPFYSTAARKDLVDILRYITRDKPNAAVSWVERIEAKCLLLASNPEMGELRSRLGRGVRCNFVGRYIIFHRKHGESVEILRVIAGDRSVTQL